MFFFFQYIAGFNLFSILTGPIKGVLLNHEVPEECKNINSGVFSSQKISDFSILYRIVTYTNLLTEVQLSRKLDSDRITSCVANLAVFI